MSDLNQKIAGLSQEKRALLEAHLLKRNLSKQTVLPAPQVKTQVEFSYEQQSLWFLDQLEPNNSFYTIPQAMRLVGALNVEALRKSFAELVRRHEVLRTQFISSDGKPIPRLVETVLFELPVVDLCSLAESRKRDEAARLIDEEARRPFDLKSDLMLRASLLRISENEHILLLNVHHIAADLWSFSVLYRELGALYEAFCKGAASPLHELRIQYSHFAQSQRKFLESENFCKQLDYWRQQFAGDLPHLEFPADHPRPKTQSYRGARKNIQVSAAIWAALKTFGQREGVTPYIILLGAFKTLLQRYTDQTDIILGSPIGGRNEMETEKLIGYFINTIPLRTDLSGDPTFRELLQRVRGTVLGAFANHEIPFEKLVDELRVPRSPDRNPLFQIIFQFFPEPTPTLRLSGTTVELIEMESGTSKMDLIFSMAETANGLAGNLEYNTELFEGETIERMLAQYGRLLEAIVENPGQNISRLNISSDAERKQLLVEWNKTETPYPLDQCIQELFEAQVKKTPDAIALVFGGQQLSYRQLNDRANQLAYHLRDCGVIPDSLVGISLDRSPELIVGLLAILKAGGAYVPLDPSYPEERLELMVRDTEVPVLITDKDFSFSKARKIHPRNFPAQSSENLVSQIASENLAYVMFTSGSTGKPKGVAVPHRAVVRLVQNTTFMQFDSQEVFLQFAPASFDASTLEIWGSLLNGAKLVIHPAELPSLEELSATLIKNKITTLWLTAGLFHQMVEQQIEGLRGVKQLLAGGDVLSVPHVKKVLEQLPECQLINGYGPTENTTFTCCYSIPKNWHGGRSVPIGKPISNTQVYILDKNLEPTPIGIPGELFIGGDGLARGYLNAPELNAQKFIANPFRPNERLYKTGDKARYLADGNIEFLGRMDHQVKIRGFRIEPQEIETILGEHPLVRQNIVVDRQNQNLEKYLLAYVTPEPGIPVTGSELRIYLEQKLPRYMVPAHFMLLKELPLNANGKVDRRQLPEPKDFVSNPAEIHLPPRNETEQKLFEIWRAVLGQNDFGVGDNFFELGGHSLLATRIASRIADEFQIQFSLRTIFECPTIADLARAVSETGRETAVRQPQLARRANRPPTNRVLDLATTSK